MIAGPKKRTTSDLAGARDPGRGPLSKQTQSYARHSLGCFRSAPRLASQTVWAISPGQPRQHR